MTDLRLPPQAIEAEQSVLGSMLLNNNAIDIACSALDSREFYRSDHRVIFDQIRALDAEGKPCDVVTVSDALQAAGKLDSAGGLQYLGALAKNTPNTANVKSYCDAVHERWLLRRTIEQANETIKDCYQTEGRPAIDIVSDAAGRFAQVEESSRQDEGELLSELLRGFVDRVETRLNSDSPIVGYKTGFIDLDNRWSGLEKGKVYVIAGRPKMGKSTMMLNLAYNLSGLGLLSHIFSLEMPKSQVVDKLVSNAGNIDYAKIRNPKLIRDASEWNSMHNGTAILAERKIIIDDQPRLSVNQIRARLRKSLKEHGAGVAFIDYLQLMRVDEAKGLSEAIGDVTSKLKEIAKSFDIPIVLLSQLNRSLENRPNKRPIPSDLRSSGAIEQDADAVIFVYREEVYDAATDQKGVAEIITSAIRDGVPGTDRVIFNGDRQRFQSFAPLAAVQQR